MKADVFTKARVWFVEALVCLKGEEEERYHKYCLLSVTRDFKSKGVHLIAALLLQSDGWT